MSASWQFFDEVVKYSKSLLTSQISLDYLRKSNQIYETILPLFENFLTKFFFFNYTFDRLSPCSRHLLTDFFFLMHRWDANTLKKWQDSGGIAMSRRRMETSSKCYCVKQHKYLLVEMFRTDDNVDQLWVLINTYFIDHWKRIKFILEVCHQLSCINA